MLSIQNLTYRIAGRTLLENASVNIPAGHRVGLVGPNGTGKTTLFKLVAGELQADAGDISFVKGSSIGMVRQDLPDDETSILDVVLNSDTESAALMKEAETSQDGDRLGYIYTRLEELGAYDAPARAATILAGLGFDETAQQSAISSFSGGWRARVALAAALFKQPNVLMLDEPTNHLDFEAMVWLENYLIKFPQTLIIISHDRDILNKTVDHIISLEDKRLISYTGNYDNFERRRAERMMNQQALHERQAAQKAKMMEFVDRFRAKASKARQAQSRLKMIEKMDIVDAVMADRVTAFRFPDPDELRSPMITLDGVEAGYTKGKPVLRKLDLRIDADDRIALLGANGNGKSTLVKLLSGRLAPMSGKINQSAKLRVGYFAQFQTDELDVSRTPYEVIRAEMPERSEAQVRASLGGFGFNKQKADTKIGELSGGEKARLLFCRMSLHAPHIMLLDEPTNHLDIDAREALMQALNNYKGAVILVSHDPHLVECVAERLWLVADGTCKSYDGDLDDYRKLVVQQRRKERSEAREAGRDKTSSNTKASGSEKEAEKLEARVAELNARKKPLSDRQEDRLAGSRFHESGR
ncbi:MAG: ABC-F family ATP-binding cassette domain-containing protein [Pseudomonadota bacterium]